MNKKLIVTDSVNNTKRVYIHQLNVHRSDAFFMYIYHLSKAFFEKMHTDLDDDQLDRKFLLNYFGFGILLLINLILLIVC